MLYRPQTAFSLPWWSGGDMYARALWGGTETPVCLLTSHTVDQYPPDKCTQQKHLCLSVCLSVCVCVCVCVCVSVCLCVCVIHLLSSLPLSQSSVVLPLKKLRY